MVSPEDRCAVQDVALIKQIGDRIFIWWRCFDAMMNAVLRGG